LSKERSASELFKHYMQLENTLELKKKMEREQELLAAWRQGYRDGREVYRRQLCFVYMTIAVSSACSGFVVAVVFLWGR